MSIAPLPSIDDCKVVCHIDAADTSQDGELALLLAAADAFAQVKVGTAIADTVYVEVDDTWRVNPTASFSPPMSFRLMHRPVDVTTVAPVVVTQEGYTLDATTYRVDSTAGIIYANRGIYFGGGPYTITYHAGLVHHPEWASKYRPLYSRALVAIVAWMFESPNPALRNTAAGGVSQSFDTTDLPYRICALLSALPGGAVSGV